MNQTSNYIFESYAIFQNADNSLMRLNPLIEATGYRFVWVTSEELWSNFYKIKEWGGEFKIPLTPRDKIDLRRRVEEFFGLDATHQSLKMEGVLLLKQIEDHEHFEMSDQDNSINMQRFKTQYDKQQEHKDIAENILLLLRLIKGEPIYILSIFDIKKIDREICSYRTWPQTKKIFFVPYTFNDEDANEFNLFWTKDFVPKPLVKLAVKNFYESYYLTNGETKYLLLMTCLESIFNRSRDQIKHTISRHTAVIKSLTKEEFLKNYKNIQKLYDLRSKIIHGQGEINGKELQLKTDELLNYVRVAIKYCQKSNLNGDQLFDYLNAKGFES